MRRRRAEKCDRRAEEDTTEEMEFEREGKMGYLGAQQRRLIGNTCPSQR